MKGHSPARYLFEFDRSLRKEGFSCLAGVDEAGRGCLAGPVVAAAVILPEDFFQPTVNDSKKLSASQREKLFTIITRNCLAWEFGIGEIEEIEQRNILQASLKAMERAIHALATLPGLVLVDGNRSIPNLGLSQRTITGGDRRSFSIACASILAKVIRDRIMAEQDQIYPEYGFARHKGYGTVDHLQALQRYGPSPIHRPSFSPVFNLRQSLLQLK